MSAYYNEIEPYAAQWLRNLIAEGLIPDGVVDERSIVDVQPEDLKDFTQCHFFAGIAGWAYALRLAGWPDDKPVWTGSCPCQPFSIAGKHKGNADERHLWPEFNRLIAKCRPAITFGEQVASKDGRKWLTGVRFDLENLGYAVGAADLCAAGAGAPHVRQRLFWVADAQMSECQCNGAESRWQQSGFTNGSGLGDSDNSGLERRRFNVREYADQLSPWQTSQFIYCTDEKTRRISIEPSAFPLATRFSNHVGRLRAYGNAIVPQVAATFISAYLNVKLGIN